MKVEVLQGEAVIGSAVLLHLDPPMGVALGPFTPSAQYDRARHANTVEGVCVDDLEKSLCVRADEGGDISTTAIAIDDFADSLGERQLTVWFANGNDYSAVFSEHDEFKAYYPDRT